MSEETEEQEQYVVTEIELPLTLAERVSSRIDEYAKEGVQIDINTLIPPLLEAWLEASEPDDDCDLQDYDDGRD